MRHTTIAVLEQIKALSPEDRRELMTALPLLDVLSEDSTAGLDEVYQALQWSYQGGHDDSSRVDELQR